MALPFESNIAQELERVRRDERRSAASQIGSYLGYDGEPLALRGSPAGPYSLSVGRASTTGDTAAPFNADGSQGRAVLTGEDQRLLTDEWGRLWVRAASPEPELEPLLVTTEGVAELQTAPIVPAVGQTLRLRWAGVAFAGGAGAGRVLMVFDSAVPVIDGAVPIWRGAVGDNGAGYFNEIDVEWEATGLPITAGFVLALSTTLDTLTLPGAAEGFFQSLHTLTT